MSLTEMRITLGATGEIRRKHDAFNQLSGANFNIFKILNVGGNEVRTHSAFIGELLNPRGSHDQGDIFLKLFLEQFQITDFSRVDCKVNIGLHVSYIDAEWTEGGNIDLILTNSAKQCVIIENKIYAGDMKNQLLRYYNYGRKYYPAYTKVLYLTLDGRNPSLFSTAGDAMLIENMTNLSYERDIIHWLTACHKEAANHATLRETITQYIHLLKFLTNQTTNKAMEEEIKKLIANDRDMFLNAVQLSRVVPVLLREVFAAVGEEMDKQLEILGPCEFEYAGKYRISYFIEEERGGYFFAVQALLVSNIDNPKHQADNNDPDLVAIRAILKRINPKFNTRESLLAFYFTDFRNFYSDSELQFENADPARRQAYVEKVLREPISDIFRFREEMKKLKPVGY